ncbi:ABC transporter permease [Erysipelothrix sp. HDW6B]|uniref:ABC transporter permease n=1 Tax=Erysipelothrix sp. HDW6B TaxID=2714929 RepID=UPI00140AEB6F|nr:ABC transporter permease [Erysipelothrix sp. HDW6B]QIK86988.1 ABC transporter permease [Erysipelothrix sp. HDW6B]
MSILNKLMKRQLGHDSFTAVMTILSVVLSVALLTMVGLITQTIYDAQMHNQLSYTEKWNAQLNGTDLPITISQMEASIDTVSYSRPLLIKHGNNIIRGVMSDANFDSMRSDSDVKYNGNRNFISGRAPLNETEVAFGSYFADSMTLGDTVVAVLDNGEPIDMSPLTVVGFFENDAGTGYGYYSQLSNPMYATQADIIFKPGTQRIDKLVETAIATNGDNILVTYNQSYNRELGMMRGVAPEKMLAIGIAAVVMTVFGLASFTMVQNAFFATMSRRQKDFGLLRSIGASKKQIHAMMRKESYVLAALGIIFGIGVGILMTRSIQLIYNNASTLTTTLNMESYAPFHLRLTWQLIGILMLVGFISVMIPIEFMITKMYRMTALETIKESTRYKRKGQLPLWARLSRKEPIRLAGKSMQRDGYKYRGIRVAIVIVVMLTVFVVSLFQTVLRHAVPQPDAYNLFFRLDNGGEVPALDTLAQQEPFVQEIAKVLHNSDHTNQVVITRTFPINISELMMGDIDYSKSIYNADLSESYTVAKQMNSTKMIVLDDSLFASVFQKTSSNEPMLVIDNYYEGYLEKGSEYVQYAGPILDFEGIETVTLTNSDHQNVNVKIHQVINEDNTNLDILRIGHGQMASPIILINMTTFNEINKVLSGPSAYEENYKPFSETIFNISSSDAMATEELLTKHFPGLHIDNNQTRYESRVIVLATVDNITKLITGMIGFIVFANLISMSMILYRERRSEFAMMRSMGMTQTQLSKTVMVESAIVTVRPMMIGLVLGVLGYSAMIYIMNKDLPAVDQMPFYLDIRSIVLLAIAIVVICIINAKVALRTLERHSIIENLKRL